MRRALAAAWRTHAVVAPGWRCYGYVWFVGCADDVITSAAYRRAALPKTISGKIRRVELRERELDRGG